MTTAEDILKKSKAKKQSTFQPVQRRAWDYLEKTETDDKKNITEEVINTADEIVETVIEKLSSPKKIKVTIEKQEHHEHKENVDLSIRETLQKKLLTLNGHQKEIMRAIIGHIKIRGGTPPYTVSLFPKILAMKIKADIDVTRVSLYRLLEKNLLSRMKGERGRNGCSKFKIKEDVVKACFTLFNDAPCDINVIENLDVGE